MRKQRRTMRCLDPPHVHAGAAVDMVKRHKTAAIATEGESRGFFPQSLHSLILVPLL